jgi:hypothetical protein
MTDHAKERADWLVDAVAAATQNRMFLRGDPEADDVVIAAIEMNARKAFSVISDRSDAPLADSLAAIEARISDLLKSGGSRDDIGCDSLIDLYRAVRVVRKWAECQPSPSTRIGSA